MADLAARAKRDPALLKKALANPGLRYKLPSSMLSVAQRRARTNAQAAKAKQQTTNALSDPTTPLSGVNLVNVAHAAVDGAYDPQIAELARQQSQAKLQGEQAVKTTGGIYDTINNYQTAALNRQTAQQAAGAQNVAGIYAGASGQVDAAAEQQRAQAARDAQVRGTGLDGGGMDALAARVASAQGNIAQRGQIAGDSLAANAQTNNAVLGGIGAATQQHRGEVQDAIGNQARASIADLAGKRTVVEGNKGADFVKQLLGLRQQSTDEYYTSAGLGLKAAGEKADQERAATTAQDRKDAAKTRRHQQLNDQKTRAKQSDRQWGRALNKYGISNAAWYQWGKTDEGKQKRAAAMAKTKAGGKNGVKFATPAAQNGAKDVIDRTAAYVKAQRDAGVPDKDIRRALTLGQAADKKAGVEAIKPVPHDLLNAAFDVAVLHGLSPANVAALHKRGLKVKVLGYKILGSSQPDPGGVASDVASAVNNTLAPG